MLRQEQIAEVIDAQQVDFLKIDDKLPREALSQIPIVDNFCYHYNRSETLWQEHHTASTAESEV